MESLTAKRRTFVRKWGGFVSAIWLTIFCGLYTFANYSTALKEVLNINQKLLNGLSNAVSVGEMCCGIVAGILSNFLPGWVLLCISAFVGFVGYGIEWLVVSRSISPLPYWVMFIAAITSGSAGPWIIVVLLNASVRNFQRNCGPVAGLFKACIGLSGAIFVAICDTLFSSSASTYLLMLIIIPTSFCIFSAIFFQPVSSAETLEEEEAEKRSLRIFNVLACFLAVYIAALTLLPTDKFKESSVYKIVVMGLLIAFAGAPALVPAILLCNVKETEDLDYNQNQVVRSHEERDMDFNDRISSPIYEHNSCPDEAVFEDSEKKGLHQPLLDNHVSRKLLQEISQNKLIERRCWQSLPFWKVEGLGEDTPTLSLFKAWHCYVLYFSLFCACGSAKTFVNNLGQVGQAFGFSETNLFPALFSLGNFFGRIVSGNVSEYFLRMKNMPRSVWRGLTKLPMPFMYLWLSTGSTASLHVGSLLLGFCLGSLSTLSVPLISEFYGHKHFSTNFTLINTYFVTGSSAFSLLAGYFYDRQALAGEESNSLTCSGAECYGTTFQIMAFCLIIALACDTILMFLSKPLYQKLTSINVTHVPNTNRNSCT